MKKYAILLFNLCLLHGLSAAAEQLQCVLGKTMIFGASISAGYSDPGTVIAAMARYGRNGESMPLDKTFLGPLKSPGEVLAEKYEVHQVTNRARVLGRGSVLQTTDDALFYRLNSDKLRSYIVKNRPVKLEDQIAECKIKLRSATGDVLAHNADLNSLAATQTRVERLHVDCDKLIRQGQIANVIDTMQDSTTWIGIDAYYWESIADRGESPLNTAERRERMDLKCNAAIRNIFNLTSLARQHDKVLVLGNIPDEKPENVSWVIKRIWTPPVKDCADKINRALKDQCHVQDRCYVLDMKGIVRDLNDGNGIFFEGRQNSIKDFRGDGLHLTKLGSRYVATRIEDLLQGDPYVCYAPSVRAQTTSPTRTVDHP